MSTNQITQSAVSLDGVITPVDEFITDMYDRIESWENGGTRREEFCAEQGPQVTVAYEAFFADMAEHLTALEDPETMTGRPDYGPADMLVDLRHLRDMNKNNVRAGSSALARRAVDHRVGIWGVRSQFTAQDGRIAGTVPAQAYAERMDATAYRLAKAINDTARLERELAAEQERARIASGSASTSDSGTGTGTGTGSMASSPMLDQAEQPAFARA